MFDTGAMPGGAAPEDTWSDPLPDAAWSDPWEHPGEPSSGAGAARTPRPRSRSGRPGDPADRGAHLRELVEQIRPVTFAHERALPVLPALEPLLPSGGLRRGATVQVAGGPGATALALALLAGPTRAGSWAACVGVPELGWAAAAELGVAMERIVVVRPTERSWTTVLAALVDAFDLVVCGPEQAPTPTEVRRLTARARERGAVVVAVGGPAGLHARRAWPGADVRLTVVAADWTGPGQGWGHLAARRATVSVEGRRGLDRPRRTDLWLPGPEGVAPVEPGTSGPGAQEAREDRHGTGSVVPFRRRAG